MAMKIRLKAHQTLWMILSLTSLIPFGYAEDYNDRFISEKSPVIAFTDARVIDGTGAPAKEKQTLVIRDGRITKIGKDGKVTIPKEAKRISLKGKSLLPGWVMTHEHLYYLHRPGAVEDKSPSYSQDYWYGRGANGFRIATPQPISYPRLYLAHGVTSARTAGSRFVAEDLRIRDAIDSGIQVGPDFDTGPIIFEAKDPDDVRSIVRFWAKQGATSIKVYSSLSKENTAAAIDEAHRLNLKVSGHLCSVTYRDAVDMGIDQIQHGFAVVAADLVANKMPDKCDLPETTKEQAELIRQGSKKITELYQHIIDNGVSMSSTPFAFFRPELPPHAEAFLNESGLRDYKLFQKMWKKDAENSERFLAEQIVNMDVAFWRAGGKLSLGSDAAGTGIIAGYSNLKSMEILHDYGIPLIEVIKIATHNGAESLGVLDDRGTIEVGKRADLLVIKGDPSVNINDIYKIETVFKNGVGYDSESLKESAIGSVGGPG